MTPNKRPPERKSAVPPQNAVERRADIGHNLRSRSEFCFPVFETSEPKLEPMMSDTKTVKCKGTQKRGL